MSGPNGADDPSMVLWWIDGRFSIPVSAYNRPSRVPGTTNLILVPLQTNEPPAGHTHDEPSQNTAKYHSDNGSLPSASSDAHTEATTSANNDKPCEHQVASPGDMTKMTPKDRKETKDFDAEESQTENVGRRWKTRG